MGTNLAGKLRLVLNSDDPAYFGHNHIDNSGEYFTVQGDWDGRHNWVQVYIPSRTGIVLALA